jgi:hypothetical protein
MEGNAAGEGIVREVAIRFRVKNGRVHGSKSYEANGVFAVPSDPHKVFAAPPTTMPPAKVRYQPHLASA